MPEIIDPKTARALGLKKYFTGKPCRRGHLEDRYVSSGGCMACDRVGKDNCNLEKSLTQKRKWRLANPDKVRAMRDRDNEKRAIYRALHPEKSRADRLRYSLKLSAILLVVKQLGITIPEMNNEVR